MWVGSVFLCGGAGEIFVKLDHHALRTIVGIQHPKVLRGKFLFLLHRDYFCSLHCAAV